jgi:hypothetical protein
VDVDAGLRTPRRSHANPRLRRKPRGGYGCVRQELAAGVIRPCKNQRADRSAAFETCDIVCPKKTPYRAIDEETL